MSATKFVCGRASWLALCAAMFTFGLSQVNAADEVAAEPQEDAARAVKQAAQAARLAWDGERRESPLLLLAAAELLGELVQAPPPEELEVHFPEAAEVATQPLGFTPHDLLEKAAVLAKAEGDEHLIALVEQRLEQLGERGVPREYAEDRERVVIEGRVFVLCANEHLAPFHPGVIDPLGPEPGVVEVPFVGGEEAIVVAVSDHDNAFFIDVTVEDPLLGSIPALVETFTPYTDNRIVIATWSPWQTRVHRIWFYNNLEFPIQVKVFANVSDRGGVPTPAPPTPFEVQP